MISFFFCRQRFLEVIPEWPSSESFIKVSDESAACSGDLQSFDMLVIYLFVFHITKSYLVVVSEVEVHVEKFLADFGFSVGESFSSVVALVD